jgi:hypothetical protein
MVADQRLALDASSAREVGPTNKRALMRRVLGSPNLSLVVPTRSRSPTPWASGHHRRDVPDWRGPHHARFARLRRKFILVRLAVLRLTQSCFCTEQLRGRRHFRKSNSRCKRAPKDSRPWLRTNSGKVQIHTISGFSADRAETVRPFQGRLLAQERPGVEQTYREGHSC